MSSEMLRDPIHDGQSRKDGSTNYDPKGPAYNGHSRKDGGPTSEV